LDALAKVLAVDLVPVPQQVTWSRIFGKGFHYLLSGPLSCRMLGHVDESASASKVATTLLNE
jgi:hypothetical protein